MEQRLELPLCLSGISYGKTRLQVVLVQCDRVRDAEMIVLPLGWDLVKHGVRKAKV